LLWQKLANIQEQLARQSAETGRHATEARSIAKEAQDLVRETAARMAMSEARLNEVALQRTQLEELMQSLSRSRDENLVVDIESALRLAQQQAQLAGSVEPLLATLKTAEQRIARAAQPRLAPVQRAITKDIARVKAATVTDTSNLLARLDELVRLSDDLPLANAVGHPMPSAAVKAAPPAGRWDDLWARFWAEASSLIRVSRVAQPEAALLTPEQSFFVRENLKLKLLNARLGLLARQLDSSRADLAVAMLTVGRYFDASSRRTQAAVGLLQQVQSQMKTLELPRVDETLAALTTAASGR
jgi:uroporphyrin-3 C-methyltransferase